MSQAPREAFVGSAGRRTRPTRVGRQGITETLVPLETEGESAGERLRKGSREGRWFGTGRVRRAGRVWGEGMSGRGGDGGAWHCMLGGCVRELGVVGGGDAA